MSVNQFLRLETETVTEMPVKIPFEFNNKHSVPQGKDPGDCIVIRPITVRTWFREVLMDNSTWEDIRILLNAVLYRIGYFPFCTSITTLRNVSPLGETEIIAAQRNLQSWQGIANPDS